MENNTDKDFGGWIRVKEKLHKVGRIRTVNIGDVWWYAAGENVRTEINGKSRRFSRPVLILKKFGRFSFWGVPLTSQRHDGSWYTSFEFQGKIETAALHQLRNIDVARLYDKIGQVPASDLKRVTDGVIELLNLK
ncbi:type II toxin-antitoxin system PemK/MazF family toxin [Candidatus Saccharibacteria bacterium]|nr:type II toxin-antitoxin system PemK/MazF family toxin [Candidatus Saccharibacteria bacterium]